MASFPQQPTLDFEPTVEILLGALVLTALAALLTLLLEGGWAAGWRWSRRRRSSLAPTDHAVRCAQGPGGS